MRSAHLLSIRPSGLHLSSSEAQDIGDYLWHPLHSSHEMNGELLSPKPRLAIFGEAIPESRFDPPSNQEHLSSMTGATRPASATTALNESILQSFDHTPKVQSRVFKLSDLQILRSPNPPTLRQNLASHSMAIRNCLNPVPAGVAARGCKGKGDARSSQRQFEQHQTLKLLAASLTPTAQLLRYATADPAANRKCKLKRNATLSNLF